MFGVVSAEQITSAIFTATADHDAIWPPIRFRDKIARGLFRCGLNPTTAWRITRAEATNKLAMFEGHSLRDGSIKHRRKGFISAHDDRLCFAGFWRPMSDGASNGQLGERDGNTAVSRADGPI